MSVEVIWDNSDRTILRYVFSDDWTWNEYRPVLQEGRAMMESCRHAVCILNDMQAVRRFPPNFISSAHNVIGSRPPNTGLAIFLCDYSGFAVLYRLLGQLLPQIETRYLLVRSEEDAYRQFGQWFLQQPTESI